MGKLCLQGAIERARTLHCGQCSPIPDWPVVRAPPMIPCRLLIFHSSRMSIWYRKQLRYFKPKLVISCIARYGGVPLKAQRRRLEYTRDSLQTRRNKHRTRLLASTSNVSESAPESTSIRSTGDLAKRVPVIRCSSFMGVFDAKSNSIARSAAT